jgi:hypothetical protein
MKSRHLYRIGAVTTLFLLTLLLTSGQAHAVISPVPEIDAGVAVSGVTLLIGSILVLVERFRR